MDWLEITEDQLTDSAARRLCELSLQYSADRERPSSWKSEFQLADPAARASPTAGLNSRPRREGIAQ
jgi:hypothetical protein